MNKRLLALLMALGLTLSLPTLAAEDVPATPGEPMEQPAQGDVMPVNETPAPQEIAPWAWDAMSEVNALGMWDDSFYYCILDEVTDEQMDRLTAAAADKLALLGLPVYVPAGEPAPLVVDHTRGGVLNALYQQVSAWEVPAVAEGPVACMEALGVVKGREGGDLALEGVCTLQEALVMAQRLVLNVYDLQDAGSKGLLWKAEGNGNTLYLLGTIHVDRDNVYPLHKSVRDAITSSSLAAFEVDFTQEADMEAFVQLQMYDDGTTLADHISPELYEAVSDIFLSLGLTQEEIDAYRPWVLAGSLTQLGISDESTGDAAWAVDLYVQSKALNNSVTVDGVESAVYQSEIFNSLSDAYQEEYLASGLATYEAGAAGAEAGDGADESLDVISAMLTAWKDRDLEAFEGVFDKEAVLDSGDELNVKLFTERDPNMIRYAADYLSQGTGNTGILVVGAGHMIGETGVVQGLIDLGYTVELVSAD